MNVNEKEIRDQIVALLNGHAHMGFDEAIDKFPSSAINKKLPNVSYSFWHVIEHMRRSQRDMLDWIEGDTYTWLTWPQDYWPKPSENATKKQWEASITAFQKDLKRLNVLAKTADLFSYAKHSKGKHTILRCLLLKADHNAYHIGEFAIGRQVMSLWPKSRK